MLEEQEKNIKQQILKQIDSWNASEEQKEQAKKQILAMNSKQLEEFLIKNKLIKPAKESLSKPEKQQCPLCLIVQNKIPAYKIDENKSSLVILEINPLSKGHTLIIPKQHKAIEKIPSQAFSLSKKIAKKLKKKLRAKEVSIQTAEFQGHGAINIIPVYDEALERKKASEQELKELQEKLIAKITTKARAVRKAKKLEKAPVRIP